MEGDRSKSQKPGTQGTKRRSDLRRREASICSIEFYHVFAANMRDLGTPVYSKQLFAETLRAFPADASVHVCPSQGRPVAASVTVRFRESVLVPWASALREFRHSCPNMLLYWSMLEHAAAVGAQAFDFGRSTRHGGTFSSSSNGELRRYRCSGSTCC